jgi:prolyl-tRNA editing enzyme YbaK/EbsC (Cys-tRNA(Pro) deacylase)
VDNYSKPQSASPPAARIPDGPARVQQALDAKQSGRSVQIHTARTDTAAAAAAAADCELGQIVKSMLFMADGRPVLLLIAGDRKADTGKLAPLLGVPRKRIKMASAAEVLMLTGYEVGGVSPLGHPRQLETLIDSSLGRFETVYAAAGSVHAVFASDLGLLQRLTGGRAVDISA